MQVGVSKERLMDLQRTVDGLQDRLQDMQWELRQATHRPLTERWWKNLLGARSSNAFMSACCNRRVRPNTKMVNYAGTRGEQ